jgi:ABC-type sugar transport system permease subunit
MNKQSTGAKTGWLIGSILIVIYSIFPIAWILSLSLKPPTDLANQSFLPTHWSLDNFSTVFQTDLFTTALRNSVGIVLISTVVSVVLATLAAWAIFDNIFIMTGGANGTESLSFLTYRQSITRVAIGLGSALSVLLFLSVVLIAFVFIKGFKVNLGGVRGDR